MTCDGFVARVPDASRFLSRLQHSDHAQPEHLVSACRSCGALHEIRLPANYTLAPLSTAMAVA